MVLAKPRMHVETGVFGEPRSFPPRLSSAKTGNWRELLPAERLLSAPAQLLRARREPAGRLRGIKEGLCVPPSVQIPQLCPALGLEGPGAA